MPIFRNNKTLLKCAFQTSFFSAQKPVAPTACKYLKAKILAISFWFMENCDIWVSLNVSPLLSYKNYIH